MELPEDVVDLDDAPTWPAELDEWARQSAERLVGTTEYPGDLGLTPDHEDEAIARMAGRRLLAYHCTRLLDDERSAIRAGGLHLLDRELVERKIAGAHALGAISDSQRDDRLEHNVFASGRTRTEERGFVCLVVGRAAFAKANNGCEPLMRAWGGEAVNGGPLGGETDLTIGTPSLVVAGLDLSLPARRWHSYPALSKLFVARLLGLDDCYSDLLFTASVPPTDVLAIWQPGHGDYDLHAGLPAS
jgi:hypothetical protein